MKERASLDEMVSRLGLVVRQELSLSYERGLPVVWVGDKLLRRRLSPKGLSIGELRGWLNGFSEGFAWGGRAALKTAEMNLKSGSDVANNVYDNASD